MLWLVTCLFVSPPYQNSYSSFKYRKILIHDYTLIRFKKDTNCILFHCRALIDPIDSLDNILQVKAILDKKGVVFNCLTSTPVVDPNCFYILYFKVEIDRNSFYFQHQIWLDFINLILWILKTLFFYLKLFITGIWLPDVFNVKLYIRNCENIYLKYWHTEHFYRTKQPSLDKI